MFLDITIIILVLLSIFLRCKVYVQEEQDQYDPYIEVNIYCEEGTDTERHLLRKEDVVEVMTRAIPGCTIVTKGGDWYNSPDDYNEIVKLLRS